MESAGDRLAAVKNARIAELGRRGQAAAAALVVVDSEPAESATHSPQDGLESNGRPPASVPGRLRAPQRAALETNLSRRGFWLAVAGIVLGWIGIGVLVVISVFFVISLATNGFH